MFKNFESTRILYDDVEVTNSDILREKPLKYITDAVIANRKTHFVHPENIDTSSKLRQTPTNLNYVDEGRVNTELYGTAPYRGLKRNNKVDQESELRFGVPMRFDECNRHITEINFPLKDESNFENSIDTNLRSISTRSDLKNTINGLTDK